MAPLTHLLDLSSLRLRPGQGRRIELAVPLEGLTLGGERYLAEPEVVPLQLEVSRMTGPGHALKIDFEAALSGPCMRCLKQARPMSRVQAREVDVRGGGPELESPYVERDTLDLAAWAHDALALAAPVTVLCDERCLGLCPLCAADLNEAEEAGIDHVHERDPDPRWATLRELKLE